MNTPICNEDSIPESSALLTISIVVFRPDIIELRGTLDSLRIALTELAPKNFVITLVDNSDELLLADILDKFYPDLRIKYIHGQGNVGFGRGHNLASDLIGKFHLILNPDIRMSSNALKDAIAFFEMHPECGLITPYAEWPDGQRQYLCKRFPSILDLFLRGFAPHSIRALFSKRLARYEMRIETQNSVYWDPPIVSGCFMFFRGSVFKEIHGFNDRFFLYFEDFDISLRARKISRIVYLPTIHIVHQGGNTAKKGVWHICEFVKSALMFYRIHRIKIF